MLVALLVLLFYFSCLCSSVESWVPRVVAPTAHFHASTPSMMLQRSSSKNDDNDMNDIIDMNMLMDMDIVLFSRNGSKEVELGAMQQGGTLAPLSAWTAEYAFDNSLEFVVDEEDRFPGLTASDVTIIKVLDEQVIGYGSRQVGGGMGPGNPHGEESEICYYVDQRMLDDVDVVINPELEIFW